MKAQVAFEYMMIFGLAIAFALPVWLYVSSLQQSTGEELSLTYAQNAVKQITGAADLVYTQGPPAKVRLNVYIPDRVEEASIMGNKTINLKVRTTSGLSDTVSTSVANLSGTIPSSQGSYLIDVESVGEYVQITVQ
jgi:hypothetical protein